MKKKFLLLTLFMCLLGVLFNSVMAQSDSIELSDEGSNTSNKFPVYNNEDYAISQFFYTADEIDDRLEGAKITSIAFKTANDQGIDNNGDNKYPYTRTLKIYMQNVDTEYNTKTIGGLPSSSCVYSGPVEFLAADSWKTIDLQSDFTYEKGKVILISINDLSKEYISNGGTSFRVFIPNNKEYAYRTLYQYNRNYAFDIENNTYACGNTTLAPFIRFTFTSGNATPTAPTVTLKSPANGKTDVFNESLEFTVSNATEYQLYMEESAATGTTNPTTAKFADWQTVDGNSISLPLKDLNIAYDGKAYAWKVVARCSDGGTGYLEAQSDVFIFTTKNVASAPGAITDEYPENNTDPDNPTEVDSNPALSWKFGENTEEYKVLFGTDKENLNVVVDWTNTGKQETASYQTSNLASNTVYYWKVITRNGVGETSSDVFSFKKLGAPDNVTPISPADGATGVSGKTIKWQFAPYTTHYRFLYGEAADQLAYCGHGTQYEWLEVTTDEVELEAPYFELGKTYYWAVDVQNSVGKRTVWDGGDPVSTFSFTTSDIQAVSYTSPINNTVISTETATLNWYYGSQNTATHYQVLLGTDPDNMSVVQDWTERTMVGTGYNSSDSFITEALNSNSKYYWQVNIKNSEITAPGEVVSFISKLDNPVVAENVIYLYPGSNIETSTELSWESEADKYDIYLNEELVTDNVTDNEYVLSGFKYNDNNADKVKIVAVYDIDGESYKSEGTMIDVYVSAYVSVGGTVKNINGGSAIANATVTYTGSSVMADNDEQVVEFVTDANGAFSGNLPAGTYVMNISADSYEDFNSEEKSYNYGGNVTDDVNIYPVIPGDVTNFSCDSQYYPLLTWTFAENTTHYRVLIGESEKELQYFDNNTNWIATDGATEGSLQTTDKYIDPNTTYYVVIDVKNENNAGERAIYPTYSYYFKPIANTFTTKPVFPVVYQAPENDSVLTDDAVTLKWGYVHGDIATHYQVLLGTDPDNLEVYQEWKGRTEVGTGYVGEEEFEISGLEFNTQYYWQVNSALEREGVYTEEAKGEVWSFSFALLPPENFAVASTQLYPDKNVELTWDVVDGAIRYNIYVDETKVAETENNSYALESLGHGTHQIAVTAASTLGESSKTEPIEVYVTAYAQVEINVKNQIGTAISGTTVTFNGTDEFGVEQSYTDTTNAEGTYAASVLLGNYTLTVNKERHSKYTTNVTVTEEKHINVVLNTYNVFDVDIDASEIDHISIYLYSDEWEDEDYSGDYNVYYRREKDADDNAVEESEVLAGPSSFVKPMDISIALLIADASDFHNKWFELPNGYYRIGVSYPGSGIINWSEGLELRDYHIFETAGSWNDSNNWRSGDMPSETSMAYLYAATEVNGNVEVQDIIVSRYGTLTINGSLTVNGKIVNEGNLNNVVLNDGGQMRQNNTELTGKFVMNIENPEAWTEDNITGWQFISTPYKNHEISYFTEGLEGNYDLYKFDGSNAEEWLNHKDESNDFEDVFVQGRGYLASYEIDKQFVTEGTSGNHVFNTSQTHTFDITNGSDASLENFHLLGNPFTFNMKWEHVHATDIVEGFSVVTKEGGYKYYPTGEIPVGDGFFVKTTSENATFVYDENRRNNREQSNSLNIKISGKEGDDNVVISFAGSGKEGFPKLENFNKGIANISVLKDDVRYGIHNCDEDLQVIELVFEASQMGLYTIEIEPNGDFDDIILVDRFTGEEIDMLNGNYKFTASNQDDYNRFFIKLSREQVSTDDVNFVYQSGKELVLNVKGTVQIVDVMGRIVYNEEVVNDVNRIDISTLRNSTYIVRVINEEGTKVKKVVVY